MKLRKCVIDPAIAYNPDLKKLEYRCLYVTLMQSCEDSGCFLIDIPSIRKNAFPFQDEITNEIVEGWFRDIVMADLIWPYEVNGVSCGYIPDFALWNSSLTRWNEPQAVPLPKGITFTKHDGGTRFNTGKYSRPVTKAQLNRTLGVAAPKTPPITLPSVMQSSAAALPQIEECPQYYEHDEDDVF